MGLNVSIRSGATAAADLSNGDQVEVYERVGEPTTYRLRYPLAIKDGDFPLLVDGRIGPGGSLTVVVPVGTSSEVLVKGEVYAQRVHFKHGVADSWVEVIGADATLAMDRDVKQVVWPAQAISDTVSNVLSSYGHTADVDSIATTTSEETHVLVQADTDLRFLRRLAKRYGHWFWVTTSVDDVTTAHFKRPALGGTPAVKLQINNTTPNVAALDLEWDVERPNATIADQLGLRDKGAIDGHVDRSPLSPLGSTALADLAAHRSVQIVAPVDTAADLHARSEAALIEAGWFVKLRGETSVRALGSLLRTHALVTVAGLGTRHSGTYVVWSVRHLIDRTAHKMEFELVRNAWGIS
ncbi:MAG: hypothetical protein HOV81_00955 [Kofleriaceae bacterium]|nr:hypothetical protein [Kofleriaceae bacterium]